MLYVFDDVQAVALLTYCEQAIFCSAWLAGHSLKS